MIFKKYKIKSLKASSLIEALIALVILIIITTFILLIMNNVNNKSNIGLKTRVINEVNNTLNFAQMENDFSDKNIDFKNFYITCQTSSCLESDKLMVFKVSAFFSNGKLILSKQRLVRFEDVKNLNQGIDFSNQ